MAGAEDLECGPVVPSQGLKEHKACPKAQGGFHTFLLLGDLWNLTWGGLMFLVFFGGTWGGYSTSPPFVKGGRKGRNVDVGTEVIGSLVPPLGEESLLGAALFKVGFHFSPSNS